MIQILENISLLPYNSFGINVEASRLVLIRSQDDLEAFQQNPGPQPWNVLGGGSNILFSKKVGGTLLKNEIKGIQVVKEDLHHVYVQVGGGEVWHEFVQECIRRAWAGVENLALIPGSVGASPIQNIGAYGMEVSETIEEVQAYHFSDRKIHALTPNDCNFEYRNSAFKGKWSGQYMILYVIFRLNKVPNYRLQYGELQKEVGSASLVSLQTVFDAVVRIRRAKLPDPLVLGNAGSFFKNPVLEASQGADLRSRFSQLPLFEAGPGKVKVPAGWLIENCGWKGYREGPVGCYEKQALVLVNYGGATGPQVLALSERIQESVWDKFGIELEREVNIW